MIIANIKDADRYAPLCKEFKAAFEFLKTLNRDTPIGKYEGDGFRASVAVIQTSDTTKSGKKRPAEAHREHLDIHYCLEGSEGIGYANVDTLTPMIEYNAENDYIHLQGETNKSILNEGYFCIVYPEDAHTPGMVGNFGTQVKKVAVKIKVT